MGGGRWGVPWEASGGGFGVEIGAGTGDYP